MYKWISESSRPKNEIFICPNCNGRVRYIDGNVRKKYTNLVKKAMCGYTYCPYCRKQLKGAEE